MSNHASMQEFLSKSRFISLSWLLTALFFFCHTIFIWLTTICFHFSNVSLKKFQLNSAKNVGLKLLNLPVNVYSIIFSSKHVPKILFCSASHSVEFILFNDFKMKYIHMEMNMLGFILISLLNILWQFSRIFFLPVSKHPFHCLNESENFDNGLDFDIIINLFARFTFKRIN